MTREVKIVREVVVLSLCYCLREVLREVRGIVREVVAQVIDFVAGGESVFAAVRAPSTTYYPGRRLLARLAPEMARVNFDGMPRSEIERRWKAGEYPDLHLPLAQDAMTQAGMTTSRRIG